MAKKSDIRLGNFIKSKREYLNITQQEIADYVGVSNSKSVVLCFAWFGTSLYPCKIAILIFGILI